MLQNYLTTAIRNLWRQKGSSLLNLSGLTLGISASLILFLLVRHHNNYDTHHKNFSRIFRAVTESKGNSSEDYSSGIPPVFPDAFQIDFPEAEEVTFTSYSNGGLVTIPKGSGEPRKFEEKFGIAYAQPNFFKIFDVQILSGNAAQGLDEPLEAILAKSWAIKYFGKEDAIGEVLRFENREFKVTAVMDDPPAQTDLPFYLMLSYVTVEKEMEARGWHSTDSDQQCYFLLKEGETIDKLNARMPAFVKKHIGEHNPDQRTFGLQPFGEIHFDDRFGNYNYRTISRQLLVALGVIAVFLVLTASINFINLTTAEAIKRSKEVGIRKTLGSSRKQLIVQFLGEASLITVASGVLALAVASVTLDWLNAFLELHLQFSWQDTMIWIFLGGITVAVSLLSGLYPSLVLSSFSPVTALKSRSSNSQSSGYALRRVLVVAQFFISQFLVIGTIVLVTQMNFFQSKDLGFRKDAILNIPIPVREKPLPADSAGASRMRTLRDELLRSGGVEFASLNNHPPSSQSVSSTEFYIEGNSDFFETQVKTIDSSYVGLFGLQLVAGKNIEDADTARGFLVNEKLSAMVGFKNPNDIIGKRIKMWGKNLPVTGVVKNFHTMSLHEPIEATVLMNRVRSYYNLSVRIQPANMQETIKRIQSKWEATYPEYIFSYEFLDESVRKFYEEEQRNSVVLGLAATLAIIIGCLGLFGLASFMANQKVKEIGVRKVLGASVESILVLFSREFVVLVFLGFVLSAPVAWYVMNQWLNEFAFKIELTPLIFVEGFAVTLLVAVLTVGYRSLRAALVNPVDSLRSE